MNHRRSSWKLPLLLMFGTIVLVAMTVIPPARMAIRRGGTACSFKHIELALMCYHTRHGCYPPQYLTDSRGKPAHSWRVLLLPYLGYDDLYRRYRFDEPWNGPHNRLLATQMPEQYRSPFQDSKSTITQYVGIAGKDTPWQGTTPLRKEDVERGFANPLIWFVEAANSDIHWMEPRDIPLEQALLGINARGGCGIQSNYPDGLPAQMMSVGCQWVPANISSDALRSMLTIAHAKDNDKHKASGKSPPSAKREQ